VHVWDVHVWDVHVWADALLAGTATGAPCYHPTLDSRVRIVTKSDSQSQIVLLRGINVGAHNRIAMPALRDLLTGADLEGVRTYLQSGNVVLKSPLSPPGLADLCKREIADHLGVAVEVIVRSRDELAHVVEQNPLGDVAVNPKRYQVSFLSAEPDPQMLDRIAALTTPPERSVAVGREIYAWHPDGVGRSRLWTYMAGRGLGVVATARNWSTVTSLLAMADE
jgi:uncharacterized protein (DUF1697 family)